MITYSTQFPVHQKLDKKTFVELVRRWNQGSQYDKFENLEWDGSQFQMEWREADKRLMIEELPHKGVIASRLQKENAYGVWKTDFILNYEKRFLTIKVALETTELTTDFCPVYYPPVFVKMIIHEEYAGHDGSMPVSQMAVSLDDKKEYIDQVVKGKTEFALPVVFLSKKEDGTFPVELSALAVKLQGAAHVIYEGDVAQLKEYRKFLGCEARNGMVFIIYPNKNMKRKVINLFGSSNDNPEYITHRIIQSVYEYSNQAIRLDLDTWEGIQNEKLHFKNSSLLSEQKTLEEETEELFAVFEEQLRETEENNKNLNREIQRLTMENQALSLRLASEEKQPLLYMGDETDFYEGEIREIILEILEDYSRNVQKDTRRAHIIADILENNVYKRIPAGKREQIKIALKGYKSMNNSLKNQLESFGIVISDDRKHYKWTYFDDPRYFVTAAKTCSDNRAGKNLASLIDKIML